MRWALVVAFCGLASGAFAQAIDKKTDNPALPAAPAAGQDTPWAAKEAPTKEAPVKSAPAPVAAPAAPPAEPKGPAVQQGQATTQPQIPDAYKLNLLIRTTVIAVNQANKTGNYSVLRDLAAPGFQAVNNPAQLAEAFAELRKRNFDLSPVLFYQPKFTSRPSMLPNGMMRLVGHFPTRPLHVTFDLIFEQVQGDWRLSGVNVGAKPAPSVEAQGNVPDPASGPVAETGTTGGTSAPQADNAEREKPAAQGAGVAPSGTPAKKAAGAGTAAPKAAEKKDAPKPAPAAAKPAAGPQESKQGLGALPPNP